MAYVPTSGRLGAIDLSAVITAASLGQGWYGTSNVLPSVTVEQQLGEIVSAYDTTANAAATGAGGYGEFIFLAVPTSTTITAGLYYTFTPSDYKVALGPTAGSGTTSGLPIALAINAVTSNASSVQYTWFQVGGRGTMLKTAVAVSPNVALYISGTGGRVKVAASTLKTIIGIRSANATTVTSTTSTVAVYLNGRPALGPGI